jgi:hypothetical protein
MPAARPTHASALTFTLTLLLATACSGDRLTEPRPDVGRELNAPGCSGVCLRDNFTGVDGTLLENHTPDGEGDPFRWIKGGNPSFDFPARIVGDAVEPADDALPRYNYFADAGAGLDVVDADIDVLAPVTSQQEVLLYLRATPEAGFLGDGWALRLIIFGDGSTEIDLHKAGSAKTFVQSSDLWEPGRTYHARFEIIADQVINFYIEDELRLSYTDGDEPLGPGTVGIGGYRDGPAQVRITGFAAGPSLQQSVTVGCSPGTPVRGGNVRCETSLAIPQPYTIVRRTASGSNFLVEDLTNVVHGPGETDVWEGPAVAASDVVVEVQFEGGATLTNQTPAHFDVQGRSWPAWQLTTLISHTIVVLPQQNMTDFPVVNTRLGLFSPDLPNTTNLPLSRPAAGPNKGLAYITDPLQVTGYLIVTHPALYPPTHSTPNGSKKWYKDQDGKGSGNCSTTAQIATLASSVERHEGLTQASNSHFGVANQQFTQLQPQVQMEALYGTANDVTFRAQVEQKVLDFFNTGPYQAAQAQFESTDTPVVLNSAGCTFDYNPNDQ